MPTWDKATGTAGTMRISDNGSTVSFIIMCSDGATFTNLTWSGVVNGQAVGGTVSLSAGFGSRTLGSWTVSSSQTVSFHINATGTSGLGGPTDHSAGISRGSVPGTPTTAPVVSLIGQTEATFTWQAVSSSSAPNYGLYISEFSNFSSHVYAAWEGNVLTKKVTVLKPGKRYYARNRVQNATGVGAYGPSVSFVMFGGLQVSTGTAFEDWVVDISDGSAWQRARIDLSDGTTWKPAV